LEALEALEVEARVEMDFHLLHLLELLEQQTLGVVEGEVVMIV